ncbi:toxin-antitoxin system YwqK family antitoxin [Brumimicrobium aurantiacum]|uniref:Toxin-antitoxin system YwqK family antitoxin n=1 Tax=Brumimicrobium aurantiacum TaxID=1737063 RepID=A0A3E1EVE5_9FLAO|nr:hypothetical protein [Brumimicrobium aurantiacum]RFC53531.1 hypothetical protein DXU93_12255 [Brumimicrobium aurantiacum]
MVKYFFIGLLTLIMIACEEDKAPERPKPQKTEYRPLISEDNNGKYTEWYPGHKQVKLTGRKNKDGERVGIWKYYSDRGVELSVTVYSNGKKNGHTVVKHPNGALHYSGEYVNDEPVGIWKFYDEQGKLTQTKDYSKK